MSYDSEGKTKAGPSPEFREWADAHHIPIESAAEDAMVLLTGEIGFLALTNDKRAIPILRQPLLSNNHMVEIVADIWAGEGISGL